MLNKREYIATTANGKRIYLDSKGSHAATHIVDTPQLLDLVRELLPTITVEDDNVYLGKDMGRIIGMTDLVSTNPSDEVIYAKRLNRDNYTRFVKNRKAQPTSVVTVVIKMGERGEYELWSAWIGPAIPQFPGDKHETPESRPFWRKHALVRGNQQTQPGSELYEWPW